MRLRPPFIGKSGTEEKDRNSKETQSIPKVKERETQEKETDDLMALQLIIHKVHNKKNQAETQQKKPCTICTLYS